MAMRFYKSYNFVDKDPVIDVVRTAVQDRGFTYQEVAELSGVSAGTLTSWFHGSTRRPQFATVTAVMQGIGYTQQWVRKHPLD